jgi:hypothetical protein
MDAEDANQMASHEERNSKDLQVDNAIRAIQEKKPLPEIDFTIHTTEDGTQISTVERVCKGMIHCRGADDAPFIDPKKLTTCRRASARHVQAHRRAVLRG